MEVRNDAMMKMRKNQHMKLTYNQNVHPEQEFRKLSPEQIFYDFMRKKYCYQ